MAQRWKTFTPNAVLPAADINEVLNPSTADHIPRAVATGITSCTVDGQSSPSVAVTFPTGRFTSAPVVVATPSSPAGAANQVQAITSAVTASGFSIRLTRSLTGSSTVIPVHWIAIQQS